MALTPLAVSFLPAPVFISASVVPAMPSACERSPEAACGSEELQQVYTDRGGWRFRDRAGSVAGHPFQYRRPRLADAGAVFEGLRQGSAPGPLTCRVPPGV